MLAVNERPMTHPVRGVRQLGSGAVDICYVGRGRTDGICCGVVDGGKDGWHIWDYVAASLIAQEAGAAMSTVDGETFDIEASSMVCTTPAILDDILRILQDQ